MEAATTLPFDQPGHVRTRGPQLLIDGMRIEDETTVRLAREREQAGEDPARLVGDAIEIGARVLDREQTGANAEFVKTEFERAARELDTEFVERARRVSERLDQKIDEAFGAEAGHVTKLIERHFDEGSSVSVQNRVKTVLAEVSSRMREDLARQFSSDSDSNPLAGFQRASLDAFRNASTQQTENLRLMGEKLEAMKLEIAQLRAEREKLEELAAVEDKGTAKGRTYEEAVFEALDAIAVGQGDDCDAVGDQPGVGGKKGDVLVAIDACAGPARGRIVFEAKNSKLSKNQALAELDEALATRGADYGVFVVPSEDKLPARTHPLREYNGDKLFVVFDPYERSRLALEVAYSLARARVLMARGGTSGVEPAVLRAEIERALGAMEDVRRVKQQLTAATTSLKGADSILDGMASAVRGHLAQIESLLAAADAGAEAGLPKG